MSVKNQPIAPQPSLLASLIQKELRSYNGVSAKVIREYRMFKEQAPAMASLIAHRSRGSV